MPKVTHGGQSFEIGIDTSDLRSTLARVAPDLEKELRVSFKNYAREGKNLMKSLAPHQSGNLASSIGMKTQFTKTKTRGSVVTNTGKPGSSYLWPQEFGRHRYGPHPGRHFVQRTGERILPQAERAVQADVERVLRKIQ